MHDLLIRDGNVIDGTGAPERRADVAVRGDRIVAIEPGCTGPARRIIEGRGCVVAPGFIDIKTHSDFTLPLYPRAESRVHQGITTELIGSCGFTAAPIPPDRLPMVADYLSAMAPSLSFRETSFAGYIELFPATSVNVAMLVGHNTVRVAVMGLDNRAPPPRSRQQWSASCGRRSTQARSACPRGLSRHRGLSPQRRSSSPWHAWLRAMVPATPPTFVTRRPPCSRLLERRSLRPSAPARGPGSSTSRFLAVAIGVAQRACWTNSPPRVSVGCRSIATTIPTRRLSTLCATCCRPGYRRVAPRACSSGSATSAQVMIRADIAARGLNAFGLIPSWEAVRVSTSPGDPDAIGLSVADIAERRGCDAVDALCAILITDCGATRGLITAIAEEDVRTFVSCPWVLVGSDGRALGPGGPLARDLPHPRFYGAFPASSATTQGISGC